MVPLDHLSTSFKLNTVPPVIRLVCSIGLTFPFSSILILLISISVLISSSILLIIKLVASSGISMLRLFEVWFNFILLTHLTGLPITILSLNEIFSAFSISSIGISSCSTTSSSCSVIFSSMVSSCSVIFTSGVSSEMVSLLIISTFGSFWFNTSISWLLMAINSPLSTTLKKKV